MDDEVYDAADHAEHGKENEKSRYAVLYVIKLHEAGAVITLADLNCERKHEYHSEYIQECNYHSVAVLGKPEKNRMEHKDQCYAESSDDQEMQLLVGKAVLELIVQGEQICVDPGNKNYKVV